jgi:hypothetical protein
MTANSTSAHAAQAEGEHQPIGWWEMIWLVPQRRRPEPWSLPAELKNRRVLGVIYGNSRRTGETPAPCWSIDEIALEAEISKPQQALSRPASGRRDRIHRAAQAMILAARRLATRLGLAKRGSLRAWF